MPRAIILLLFLSAASLSGLDQACSGGHFLNPIDEGADPWIVRHDGRYYRCRSKGDRGVVIQCSDTLTAPGEQILVWKPASSGPHSSEIWAPEMHFLDEHWYIYVAASDGQNINHRMIVLESFDDDPLGPYKFKAELYTGDNIQTKTDNRWAIDGTVLSLDGRRYFIWSGWEDERDEQWLYIARMSNPWTISDNRIRLCNNDDHLWERVGESANERGLNEGPQILQRNGRTFIIYSASGSWQTTYKLGLLELKPGADPMKPGSWRKHPEPVFASTEKTFGVGHASFTISPDGREDWIVYHAKVERDPGWRRAVFAQPFTWTADGFPLFGSPVPPGQPLPAPSGQSRRARRGGDFSDTFAAGYSQWQYLGHHELIQWGPGQLTLGDLGGRYVNFYRSGEKVLLPGYEWSDLSLTVRMKPRAAKQAAGILVRATGASVGRHAFSGYFAGVIPEENVVLLGRSDGAVYTELARARHPVAVDRACEITTTAIGDKITVTIDGRDILSVRDSTCPAGVIGLRVDGGCAQYEKVGVKPVP